MNACDDIFLARFRGLPCVICGKSSSFNPENGKATRTGGHHLHHKGNCRKFRYERMNIIDSLCVQHHSKWATDISPHSEVNGLAVERFVKWVRENRPEQYKWWKSTEPEARELFDKSWTYREMYELLGGEILKEKDGKKLPMKDWKPMNHKRNIKEIVDGNS
jgi:hypothetical protein